MRKWLKRSFVVLVVLVAVAQFVRPARTNPVSNPQEHIQAVLPVHPEVAAAFSRACNDCHSNTTAWPWYSNVAPASWLVANDVNEGREEMNFSAWGTYKAEKQQKLLGKICEEVREGEMPGAAYTLIHRDSKLSNADRQAVCSWTKTVGASASAEKDHDKEDEGD